MRLQLPTTSTVDKSRFRW